MILSYSYNGKIFAVIVFDSNYDVIKMDDEAIKLINDRLDIIEDKLARLDPYNLNEFLRTKPRQLPDGYTSVGTVKTRTS